jgi:hypothetical protein
VSKLNLAKPAPAVDWQKTAIKNGWVLLQNDRQNDDGYFDKAGDLWHQDLDRVFFGKDWEGACQDLDLDIEDMIYK